jgi:hypothetical protein
MMQKSILGIFVKSEIRFEDTNFPRDFHENREKHFEASLTFVSLTKRSSKAGIAFRKSHILVSSLK